GSPTVILGSKELLGGLTGAPKGSEEKPLGPRENRKEKLLGPESVPSGIDPEDTGVEGLTSVAGPGLVASAGFAPLGGVARFIWVPEASAPVGTASKGDA